MLAAPIPFLNADELQEPMWTWGTGQYRHFGFLVYEATLEAGADPQNPPLKLRLDYKRALAGKNIAKASVKEMRRVVDDESLLTEWGTQMERIFPDVESGDHIIGHYNTDGAVFSQDNRMLGQIRDPEFARAFFAIWLGPQTSAPKLRAALLNGKTA